MKREKPVSVKGGGVEVRVSEEEWDSKSVKKNGRWKYEFRNYLVLENNDSDEMEISEV